MTTVYDVLEILTYILQLTFLFLSWNFLYVNEKSLLQSFLWLRQQHTCGLLT